LEGYTAVGQHGWTYIVVGGQRSQVSERLKQKVTINRCVDREHKGWEVD
jgi:hypothetical protein